MSSISYRAVTRDDNFVHIGLVPQIPDTGTTMIFRYVPYRVVDQRWRMSDQLTAPTGPTAHNVAEVILVVERIYP